MKRSIILSLAFALGSLAFLSNMGEEKSRKLADTDKYKVIRVDGRIIFQRTKTDMKKGDVFLSGTILSFKTPQSRAAVISALKGRYVLSASEKGTTKILPAANNVPSRAGGLVNEMDFSNHLKDKCVFIGETVMEVGGNFKMADDRFFYLAYDYEGETIRKKLDSKDETHFILDKEEIFKVDGKSIDVAKIPMVLFYRNGAESFRLAEFTPVFPDLTELKEEVEIIVDEFDSKDDGTKIEEVGAYLNEFYGKTQRENLESWLNEEFGLKGASVNE